ncbi:MAG: four helix bundle protein [Candidatus Latescibacteria bacterium]|nr:four helix bundle protein [Candidatus Latescibacterota bacterium]
MVITHFRKLRVYQQACESAMRIFELSKDWPGDERFSLTDQIRRSSRSVCGSIAEAWRKRRYVAHFISKLSDADGEAAETQSWLDFALRCGYLSKADFTDLDQRYEVISGGLVKMMTEPEKWCGPANLLREEQVFYEDDTESGEVLE